MFRYWGDIWTRNLLRMLLCDIQTEPNIVTIKVLNGSILRSQPIGSWYVASGFECNLGCQLYWRTKGKLLLVLLFNLWGRKPNFLRCILPIQASIKINHLLNYQFCCLSPRTQINTLFACIIVNNFSYLLILSSVGKSCNARII